MTREDIIRMAKECGNWSGQTVEMNDVGLERFAALCIRCHAELDQGKNLTSEERQQMWESAFRKTLVALFEQGKIKCQ